MGIAIGALLLRLYRLDFESLHMDEIVTVATYHRSIWGIVTSAAVVGQPPLDNFLGAALYATGLAGSDWWVRFPAAVFGAGGILLLGWWVSQFAGTHAGVAAALLLAVCPLHVTMSQEARPYALTFFLCLATILTFSRARERQTRTAWITFSAITFLFLMTRWTDPHFVTLGIAAYAVAVWLREKCGRHEWIANPSQTPSRNRNETMLHPAADGTTSTSVETRTLCRTAVALCVPYALYSPVFWIVLSSSGRAIDAGSTTWSDQFRSMISHSFAAMFWGYSERTVYWAQPGAPWIIALGATLTLLGVGILLIRSRRGDGSGLFLWVLLPFPILYATAFAKFASAIPKPQYLLPMAALVCGAIGVGLDALCQRSSRRRRRIGMAATALAGLALAWPMAHATVDGLQRVDNRDWRAAMKYLKTHARPGDAATTLASDTVPPVFAPIAYGKDRYGAAFLDFLPITQTAKLDAFDADVWRSTENTVWLLVYTDRMYLGFDQVPPPSDMPLDMEVQSFDGLFLVRVHPGRPSMDRLLDGIAAIYNTLPDGRALIAPAILGSTVAARTGKTDEAAMWFNRALRQCRPGDDVEFLAHKFSPGPPRLATVEENRPTTP